MILLGFLKIEMNEKIQKVLWKHTDCIKGYKSVYSINRYIDGSIREIVICQKNGIILIQ